jgi:hypothetical protein
VLVVSLTQERTGRLKVETETERVRLTAKGGGGRKLDDFHPKSGAAVQREKTRNQKSNGKIKEIKTNTKY